MKRVLVTIHSAEYYVDAGQSSPRRRRPPRHRCRRERMPQEGMLMQIDGSPHSWLEKRGPWLTLLLAVDDATGKVPYAIFEEKRILKATSFYSRA